jgi:hypothetical protein
MLFSHHTYLGVRCQPFIDVLQCKICSGYSSSTLPEVSGEELAWRTGS